MESSRKIIADTMRILVICDHFYPEEFIINDLVKEWSTSGHDIHVITPNPAYPKGIIYEGYKNRLFQTTYWDKIIIHRVFTVQGFHRSLIRKILNYLTFPVLGTIHAVLLARKFDRIFVYQVGPLTQAIPAIIARKLFNKKVAIWSFDIWPDTVYAYGFKKTKVLSSLLNKLVKFIYRNCNTIFIPSEGFKKAYTKYTEEYKLIYAPNWCINNDPVKHTGFSFAGKTNFTFAGNIGKVQNLSNVILGFELALQANKEIILNIIGDGSFLPDLKNLVQEKTIPNVVFWGRKPYNEMNNYYEASDFLIISLAPDPVYDLYIPAKFQSYLQTGKPILSIMNGQVSEFVSQHDIGLVATPDNIEDIAEKIIQCTLMSKETLNSIQMNSRKLLRSNFDRMKIIETITNELIKG